MRIHFTPLSLHPLQFKDLHTATIIHALTTEHFIFLDTLDFFTLDPKSGELRTAKPLDRDALQVPDGVVKLKVKVSSGVYVKIRLLCT